jgi:hypothetical protein
MTIYDVDGDAGRRGGGLLLLLSDSERAVGEETMDFCLSTYHAAAPRKSPNHRSVWVPWSPGTAGT